MKLLLLGGLGVVGKILTSALSKEHLVVIGDLKADPGGLIDEYIQVDISHFDSLIRKIPKDLDAIINLAALPESKQVVNEIDFVSMANVYITGSYNVFLAAAHLAIPKVIFASSNHVTGDYEQDGQSSLRREIRVNDAPLSDSVYGAMKLCAEQFGRIFSTHFAMSVISLRLGTVVADEYEFLMTNARARHTILSKIDTADIFAKAIHSNVKHGIYYAVSDNPRKPWSIQEAIADLGYTPKVNSDAILSRGVRNEDEY